MSDAKAGKCERCGREAEQIGFRLQPVILGGDMITVRGVFCEHCAAEIAESDNWGRIGNGSWQLLPTWLRDKAVGGELS